MQEVYLLFWMTHLLFDYFKVTRLEGHSSPVYLLVEFGSLVLSLR